MIIRPAEWKDWARVLAWRNDPASVDASGSDVSLKVHVAWFRTQLALDPVPILIGSDPARGVDIGMVRLDHHENHTAEISIVVDPVQRGRGYATWLLGQAEDWAREHGLRRLTARVETENYGSLRLFTQAGFVLTDVFDGPFVVFTKELV